MTVQERLYTADDLWEISHRPENDEMRFELVEGVLIEMPPAGGEHGVVGANFLGHIWNFVRENNLGHVTTAETGFILFSDPDGKDTVRAPDVGFVALSRAPHGLPVKYVPLVPDLVVEVVSPNDKAVEIDDKLNDYLRAGVPMIVLVYSGSRSILVYQGSDVRRLGEDDIFEGGDVLPGFKLPVRDVFPR